ncbi:pyridoxamine 5'-phosphate oxidase family protein [Nocardioides anomalus]|uniref:Pyridoxamine 5'-phosphate oxidase family protein n=1 Tax=Nocardioides anomalus TaxID=2712223 RepID=A0A6G6WA19_9ACTN|nr:pyridoxamine 5'-phosphate oxidase family protein [Nocardioides anomalus]QIG41993.1 pyridoxamine 5'-phosphate oxidase family protein [Nocardioides anomalus]
MTDDQAKLVELMNDMYVAMFTTTSADGTLRSVPMARQEVEPSAELWFITARDTEHVRDVQARPHVGLTFSSRDAWVSINGTAEVVDDKAKLEELWNTFAEAWLPGGPDDPNATLIRVDAAGGEYWDSPGGKVASMISFVKTKLTGDTYDTEHGSTSL